MLRLATLQTQLHERLTLTGAPRVGAGDSPSLTASNSAPDRASMARAAFYLLALGSTIGLVSLALPGNLERDRTAALAISLTGYALATVVLVGFTRLPPLTFEMLAGGGTVLVSVGVYLGGESGYVFALFYFWIILYAGYFFRPGRAAIQLAAVALGSCLVLAAGPPPALTPTAWLVTMGTLAVVCGLVVFLKTRLSAAFEALLDSFALLKEREQDASVSSSRLRSLIDASPAAIFALDHARTVQLWSRAAEQLFGWQTDEIIGQTLPVIPTFQPGAHDPFRLAERNGAVESEVTWIGKDGRPVDIVLSLATTADADGGLIGIASDISRRKQLEQELRQAQKMEAVGRLAGGIAHDFNNILLAINSQTWLLAQNLESTSDAQELVEAIERAAARGSALTRQLLAFGRRQVAEPVVLDLSTVLEEMVEMLEHLIGENIDLTTNLEPDCFVHVDRGQVEQVIVNLVVNASEAMPEGGTLTITTRRPAPPDRAREGQTGAAQIVLEVADTGTGINPEDLPHIFEPFFSTKPEGSGLGLATVHGIVSQQEGRIEARANSERGATFSLYLPRVEATPGSPAPQLTTPARNGNETLLLVEDDEQVRTPLHHVLHQHGYHVLTAANGQEALRTAQEHLYLIDLLVSDIVMPDLNGDELARQLTQQKPGLKVIYTSGYPDRVRTPSPDNSLAHNAAFLRKPYEPDKLLHMIRRVLDEGDPDPGGA